MSPVRTYKLYVALHNHFTTSYDYFRYNGKTHANINNFESRTDKHFLQKIGKHKDPPGLILSNLIVNPHAWSGDLVSSEAQEIYDQWKKRTQSLRYTFNIDLKKLDPDFDSNFRVIDGNHPTLLKLYLSEEICLETFSILVKITGCNKVWDKKLDSLDPMWPSTKFLWEKYTPFLPKDLNPFRKICLTHFQKNSILNKDGTSPNTNNISNK